MRPVKPSGIKHTCLKDLAPSELSKNLYIDWFDEYGKLLKRTIAPVINATASGDFTIPQNYNGSRLQVMAYTKVDAEF
jgi:hypothetical protein